MNHDVSAAHAPIGVALFGMDERSISRMSTIFKMVYKGRCEHVEGNKAKLGIVDIDTDENAWSTFRQQFPELPAIVMSETGNNIKGSIFVAKPAKLDFLWESIFSLVSGLPRSNELQEQSGSTNVVSLANNAGNVSTRTAVNNVAVSGAAGLMNSRIETQDTSRKSVKNTGLKDIADIYFNPDEYLLGAIVSSIKENAGKNSAIYVKCWKDRKLILLPDQNKAFTDLKDNQLKNLGVATFSEDFSIEINNIAGGASNVMSGNDVMGLQQSSLDYFLWDLSLRTARGRIPEGVDPATTHYLRCWPNFTRLPVTENGMRIASLWVENPRSLVDIANNLDIDIKQVYSFYSAATMTGLAGSAARKVDNLVEPEPVQKKEITRRGLLSSILRQINKKR